MQKPRQSSRAVDYDPSVRQDETVAITSGRAGVVAPLTYIPVLRGDSAAGRITVNTNLGRMPKPLLNAVQMNVQAWFVPKGAMPQFNGPSDLLHSYQKQNIRALGQAERQPPPYFHSAAIEAEQNPLLKVLGIHNKAKTINTDIIDAFNVVYNFRLQAHSSKMTRRQYYTEDAAAASTLPRAFWPKSRMSDFVPDYERALVVGQLDLDVTAGRLPVEGLVRNDILNSAGEQWPAIRDPSNPTTVTGDRIENLGVVTRESSGGAVREAYGTIYANMVDQRVTTSLADIDKARVTQSFAKLRALYAGMDPNGFVNDDAIIAELMQGLDVPPELMQRPFLLDSQRAIFGMAERFSTTATDLEKSISEGQAYADLSINLPRANDGGLIIVTVEVLPERIDEAMEDAWLSCIDPEHLPDALRDIQNPEPVEIVNNSRVDMRHTTPDGLYGYEPLNGKWKRAHTRLGGKYYQPDPQNPFTEQRAALWLANIVNPTLTDDHWLAPANFPHNVFSDTAADAWETVVRHDITLRGVTQFGETLNEDNQEYAKTKPPAPTPTTNENMDPIDADDC